MAGVVAAMAVVALVACKQMPSSGIYSTQQYSQITTVANLKYGEAVSHSGATVDLLVDLYLPPASAPSPRPVVILIHGGGFTSGNKSQMASAARSYAARGFAAASISYRLDPQIGSSQTRRLAAALNGIDDGMESVRWLRSKASTYKLDTSRIAMVGSSAGGVVAMGTAVHDDPTPGGPLAAYSPKISAAVSTGVNLTPGFDLGLIQAQATDAPILMYHHGVDTTTGDTFEYASKTCTALTAGGAKCTIVRSGDSGHTVSLSAGNAQWTDRVGTFLWQHMDLHSLTN